MRRHLLPLPLLPMARPAQAHSLSQLMDPGAELRSASLRGWGGVGSRGVYSNAPPPPLLGAGLLPRGPMDAQEEVAGAEGHLQVQAYNSKGSNRAAMSRAMNNGDAS